MPASQYRNKSNENDARNHNCSIFHSLPEDKKLIYILIVLSRTLSKNKETIAKHVR